MTTYYLALSIGFAISVVALIFVLISPKTDSTAFHLANTEKLNPTTVKAVNMISGDILSLLPKDFQRKSINNSEVDEVFNYSGNPWGVTKMEFFVLRVTYAFGGFILGVFGSIIVSPSFFIGLGITFAATFLGWNYPISAYRRHIDQREADFKRYFPEFLDYLTMTMSAGQTTLSNSIEKVLPYLPESAVKDEFGIVVASVNSGMSTEDALNNLAGRIPTPSLQAFVKAVNNANKLSTPMTELMKVRAKNTRKDLLNEIELIIQSMPTKVMVRIAPATIVSMLTIFLVPVIVALISSL